VNVPADPTKILFWISLDLDQDQAEQVAAQCREVGRAGVGRFFPYANSSPRGFFLNERLEFIYGAGSLGLTCASFVLAVFNFVGIDLVNYDSWPIRPGDEQWLEKIIRQMPQAHAKMMRDDETKVPRYKPAEVAAAMGSYPVRFCKAARCARKIRERIADLRGIAWRSWR
jgi:hypothetical protein